MMLSHEKASATLIQTVGSAVEHNRRPYVSFQPVMCIFDSNLHLIHFTSSAS